MTRLALAVFLLSCAAACAGRRPVAVDARTSSYRDDDRTAIDTTAIAVRVPVGGKVTASGRYLVDAVSSASVDVVSAATGRWTEQRKESEAALSYDDGTSRASASYVYSGENDWWSHNGAAGASRDFRDHQLTVGLGAVLQDNRVGRSHDGTFEERMRVAGGSANVTVVLTPSDLLDVSYGLTLIDGYQASPYRLVRFEDPSAPGELVGQDESLPDHRVRHAVTTRWNRHAFRDTAFRSHVRLYADDWGVASLTGGTEWVTGFAHGFETGLSVRGYSQTGASFYEDTYAERRRYMTSDRELSRFEDVFAGGRLSWRRDDGPVVRGLRGELKLSWFLFTFDEFDRLPRREGFVAEAALGASF